MPGSHPFANDLPPDLLAAERQILLDNLGKLFVQDKAMRWSANGVEPQLIEAGGVDARLIGGLIIFAVAGLPVVQRGVGVLQQPMSLNLRDREPDVYGSDYYYMCCEWPYGGDDGLVWVHSLPEVDPKPQEFGLDRYILGSLACVDFTPQATQDFVVRISAAGR